MLSRAGLIHTLSFDSRKLKWSEKVTVLLSNCKQNTASLSLLVGTTVNAKFEKGTRNIFFIFIFFTNNLQQLHI